MGDASRFPDRLATRLVWCNVYFGFVPLNNNLCGQRSGTDGLAAHYITIEDLAAYFIAHQKMTGRKRKASERVVGREGSDDALGLDSDDKSVNLDSLSEYEQEEEGNLPKRSKEGEGEEDQGVEAAGEADGEEGHLTTRNTMNTVNTINNETNQITNDTTSNDTISKPKGKANKSHGKDIIEIDTVSEFQLPSEHTATNLFLKRDLKLISSLIHEVSNSKTEKMYQTYKQKTETQLKKANSLVQQLTLQNNELKMQLKQEQKIQQKNSGKSHQGEEETSEKESKEVQILQKELEKLRGQVFNLTSQMDNLKFKLSAKEKKNNDLEGKLSLFGIITKLTCLEIQDTSESMIFKLRQKGRDCVLFFDLKITKDSSDEGIYYIPDIDNIGKNFDDEIMDFKENAAILRSKLDDYLLDPLVFPAERIGPLYYKLSRSLT